MYVLSVVLVVADPRQWTEHHVAHWLSWAIREFSLDGVHLQQFYMRGKDILAMGKDTFLVKAPAFTGDILWEHLEMLQKGESENQRGVLFRIILISNTFRHRIRPFVPPFRLCI